MKKCVFTIVAKNYIGLGQILGESIKKFNSDIDFYIFVADELNNSPNLPNNVIFARHELGYSDTEWIDMAFKYDLTEFCTSIKPASFQWLFQKGYDYAIYLDPDIYVFRTLSSIYEKLEQYDIALTPQIAGIHVKYTGEHPEWAMNVNGIFNLGFCAMRNSQISSNILAWWRLRLQNECFVDRSVGDFTDQKWMDWLPGFLGNEHLYVFHSLGMNIAPWNFFEREIYADNGILKVKYRTSDCQQRNDDLVFMHFAGYDYEKMKKGIIARKRIENLEDYADLKLATSIYKDALVENKDTFDTFIHESYSYSTFDNGAPIISFQRRLYHGLSEVEKKYTGNPFKTKSNSSYYNKLKKRRLLQPGNIDKLTQRNMPNIDKKRHLIALLFTGLYRIMGFKRYILFVKSLYNYCRPELHTFLINKK